jgi:hypothetical protein
LLNFCIQPGKCISITPTLLFRAMDARINPGVLKTHFVIVERWERNECRYNIENIINNLG